VFALRAVSAHLVTGQPSPDVGDVKTQRKSLNQGIRSHPADPVGAMVRDDLDPGVLVLAIERSPVRA
jgi:hypothetical protein